MTRDEMKSRAQDKSREPKFIKGQELIFISFDGDKNSLLNEYALFEEHKWSNIHKCWYIYVTWITGFDRGGFSGGWFPDQFQITEKKLKVSNVSYNTKCPICGKSALDLCFILECSNPSCQNYRK